MLEVCSTTLPQFILPDIYEDPRYKKSLQQRIKKYQKRADIAEKILSNIPSINFTKPKGAFYLSIAFHLDKCHKSYVPEIKEDKVRNFIDTIISPTMRFDKKFCYYLLAKT
jgi:alanine-synthesizing transaminase